MLLGFRPRGFSALVPIPNGRGRHRAAPFGVGPWDGARVASTAEPYPPPRSTVLYRNRTQAKKETRRAKIQLVVRSELLGNLRSLPLGPTRCRTLDAAAWASNGQGQQHDALIGVALAARNSH